MPPTRDIVVIGGSAGAIEALLDIVPRLPTTLPARVFVAIHIPPTTTSALPAVLGRAGRLPARHPVDGEHTEPGSIYVAPPDHHLLVELDRVRVVRGAPEHRHRPAVDVLFRSAAESHGSRVVAVVLSGNLDDGIAGARAVVAAGGAVLVQDPADALCRSMPENTLATEPRARAVPVDQLADELLALTMP
jgi:two-component system chemotaxis response regulator CheB